MSSEEESFIGYESNDVDSVQDRSKILKSVIHKLAYNWNLLDSPEKKAEGPTSLTGTVKSIPLHSWNGSRPGSLDLRTSRPGSLDLRTSTRSKSLDLDKHEPAPANGEERPDVTLIASGRSRTESLYCFRGGRKGGHRRNSQDYIGKVGSQQDGISEYPSVDSDGARDFTENDEDGGSVTSYRTRQLCDEPEKTNIVNTSPPEKTNLINGPPPEKGNKNEDSIDEELPQGCILEIVPEVTRTDKVEKDRVSEPPVMRRSSVRGKLGHGSDLDVCGRLTEDGDSTGSEDTPVRETRQRVKSSLLAEKETQRLTRSGHDSTPEGRGARKTGGETVPEGRLVKRTGEKSSQSRLAKRSSDFQTQGRADKRTVDTPTRRASEVPPEGRTTRRSEQTTAEESSSRVSRSRPEVSPEKPKTDLEKDRAGVNSSKLPPPEKAEGRTRSRREEAQKIPSSGTELKVSEAEINPRKRLRDGSSEDRKRTLQELPAEGRQTRRGLESQTDGADEDTRIRQELNKSPARAASSPKKADVAKPVVEKTEAHTSEGAYTSDGAVTNFLIMRKKKKKLGDKVRILGEADIIRRVQELKGKGLWVEKKIPKSIVEPRNKVHWDFVLEEMTWLSDVVQKEVKAKKANAKKCAMMVQKYFKDKELAAIRAEKVREANLRKIASNMGREIKLFWGNAHKLFEWRVKQKLEKKRKEALDQHLNFIVDKTEKYSTLLAESLAENASGQVSRAASVSSGDTNDGPGDGEYNPDSASSDDEETIEQEETQEQDAHRDKELEELEQGAEVPIEELLRKYYPDQFAATSGGGVKEETELKKQEVKEDPAEGTGRRRRKPIDFSEVERKIQEEEKILLAKKMDAKDETDVVKDEAIVKDEAVVKDESSDEEEKGPGIKSLVEGEDKLEEYASMAAKFQPTGNTLETTTVKTRVPALLKHTLREYQHIGLDWLVSLYERGLNGILADEMGLGKTIQTIALLAHMAVDRQNWGPHLIVVPTSVMLNWEMEIKKWCPGFKVMVYFGSQKDRKLKRVGWTKPNAFHICITSYKLVIQDHSSFRRFKWQYFILDEAQHIKNFKSQRWQLLLNFASVGRLLLTGTPLQNNLMELWSLMHFLMPHVFESHRDFKEWFSNPLTGMVEGNSEYNENLIKRLHKVLRPFLLRRLKNEVEKQLPKKYEHLVKCPLSKRQRFLYDDFMSRAKTRETLASGNLLSVINVLMQLRKCCNHPNLFEPRPTLSPFVMQLVEPKYPRLADRCLSYSVFKNVDLSTTQLLLVHHELCIDPYTAYRASSLKCSSRRMLHPPTSNPKFMCPTDKVRMRIKTQNPPVPKQDIEYCSPVLHLQQTGIGYVIPARNLSNRNFWLWQDGHKLKTPAGYFQIAKVPRVDISVTSQIDSEKDIPVWSPPKKVPKVEVPKMEDSTKDEKPADPEMEPKKKVPRVSNKPNAKGIFSLSLFSSEKMTLAAKSPNKAKKRRLEAKAREAELHLSTYSSKKETYMIQRRKRNLLFNTRRCEYIPLYGSELVESIQNMSWIPREALRSGLEQLTCRPRLDRYSEEHTCYSSSRLIQTAEQAVNRILPIFDRFIIHVPKTWTAQRTVQTLLKDESKIKRFSGDFLISRFQVQVPDTRLIQYDCGKLQVLSSLLRKLHIGGHRALIFTQMTKMLDILEAFLNYHGYVYMRLDGSTKVEMRQALMERFNNNSKYFIFILSTRSGGVGINLTGADTVIFYDSDWNPTMDAQAQDRCHRIGQTRDVHIYRLISERTVEENILKKANQKRLLGDLAIEGGNFTTAFFKKQTIHDLFEETATATQEDLANEEDAEAPKKSVGVFESALATAEDDTDRQAAKVARAEENQDEQDFSEQTEEDQFQAILAELSKVEVYALRQMEWQQEHWVQEQLDAAQAEIEARKEEFDAEKLDELTQEIREEMGDDSTEDEEDEESDDDVMEYAPEESDTDDEDTIAKDEKEVDEKNHVDEINMLANDAEVPLEELIKLYYPDQYKEMDLEVQTLQEEDYEESDMFEVLEQLKGEPTKNKDQEKVGDTADMSVNLAEKSTEEKDELSYDEDLVLELNTSDMTAEGEEISCRENNEDTVKSVMHDIDALDNSNASNIAEKSVLEHYESPDQS